MNRGYTHRFLHEPRSPITNYWRDGITSRQDFVNSFQRPRCWWCSKEWVILVHIFWSCPKIRQYWLGFPKSLQPSQYQMTPPFFCFIAHKSLYRHTIFLFYVTYLILSRLVLLSVGKTLSHHWLHCGLIGSENVRAMEDLVLSAQDRKEQYTKICTAWDYIQKRGRDCWEIDEARPPMNPTRIWKLPISYRKGG